MRLRLFVALGILAGTFACGGSYSSPSQPTPTPSPTPGNGSPVSIVRGASALTAGAFAPDPITVSAGGSVTWTNNDTTTHTSSGDGGAWNSGNIAPGSTYTRSFSTAGSFTYHCAIHPGMIGRVVVQ